MNAFQSTYHFTHFTNLSNAIATNQSDLLDAILKERRLELSQEAQRWDDLVRFDKVVEVMSNLQEIDLRTGNATDYGMSADKILLPIPQEELDRNPKLLQN